MGAVGEFLAGWDFAIDSVLGTEQGDEIDFGRFVKDVDDRLTAAVSADFIASILRSFSRGRACMEVDWTETEAEFAAGSIVPTFCVPAMLLTAPWVPSLKGDARSAPPSVNRRVTGTGFVLDAAPGVRCSVFSCGFGTTAFSSM